MNSPRLKSRSFCDQCPVIELLDTVRERLWPYYGADIQNRLREQQGSGQVGHSGPLDDPPS